MKTYYLSLLLLLFSISYSPAQEGSCKKNLKKVKKLLKVRSPFTENTTIFKLVEPCALQGDPIAENYLAMLYINGIGVAKDADKAFTLFSSAAEKQHHKAQYNLGRMYKYGIGCTVDYKKAIEWFKKAAVNGNQRAAYSIGYMHYKGLGIKQDYEQAIHWFNRSTDPMARHYLGLSNYLGYGVPANEDKALEILLDNSILNSKTLVTYIKAEQKKKAEAAIAKVMSSNASDANGVATEMVSAPVDVLQTQKETPTVSELTGDWVGKLVEYDWSGKYIQRILPIAVTFKSEDNTVAVTCEFLGKTHDATALWQDDYLYFDTPINFTLDKLYSSNPKELSLDHTTLAIDLQKQKINATTYLTGTLDTYIEAWTEYGQPMGLVLKPKGTNALSEEDEINEALILALDAQKQHFIKLYPVPFIEVLTIYYELENPAEVSAEIAYLYGGNKQVLATPIMQEAGEHSFTTTINSSFPKGLYVVKLSVGSKVYTRIVIKEN